MTIKKKRALTMLEFVRVATVTMPLSARILSAIMDGHKTAVRSNTCGGRKMALPMHAARLAQSDKVIRATGAYNEDALLLLSLNDGHFYNGHRRNTTDVLGNHSAFNSTMLTGS